MVDPLVQVGKKTREAVGVAAETITTQISELDAKLHVSQTTTKAFKVIADSSFPLSVSWNVFRGIRSSSLDVMVCLIMKNVVSLIRTSRRAAQRHCGAHQQSSAAWAARLANR